MSKLTKHVSVESPFRSFSVSSYVHIDMKGAPPKPSYLKNIWPIFKRWGVKGVIIEWEDCFPYKNNLRCISNKLFNEEDIAQILLDTKNYQIEVIPLVQTFGHLEFLLKHPNFKTLREEPLYPSSVCPSHPETLLIIEEMLNQVMSVHKTPKYIHIGADEVWHMGLCERCKARLLAGETKEDLFLTHIKLVLESIKLKWPETRCIMWDDMLRSIDESVLRASNLSSLTEVMVWHYNPGESFSLPPGIWQKYGNTFTNGLWVAGVFKGAAGGSQLLPPVPRYAANALEWAKLLNNIRPRCKGFVATGWSRYDHYAGLCETLPISLVSLGTVFKVFQCESFSTAIIKQIETELRFSDMDDLCKSTNPEDQALANSWKLFQLTLRVCELRKSALDILLSDQLQTWMNEWQIANNFVNPMQIIPMIPTIESVSDDFDLTERNLRECMTRIFYETTIEEWVGTYISPIRSRINSALRSAESIIQKAKEDCRVVAMEL